MDVYDKNSGDLLWSSQSMGSRDAKVTEQISAILKNLLSDVEIKSTTSVDMDDATRGVIEAFVSQLFDSNVTSRGLVTSNGLYSLIEQIVNNYLGDNTVKSSDFESVRNNVQKLLKRTWNVDTDWNEDSTEDSNYISLISRINSVNNNYQSVANSVNSALLPAVFVDGKGNDSQYNFVLNSRYNTDKDNVDKSIESINNTLGEDVLSTTSKTVRGAINELKESIPTDANISALNDRLTNVENTTGSVSKVANSASDALGNITKVDSRLSGDTVEEKLNSTLSLIDTKEDIKFLSGKTVSFYGDSITALELWQNKFIETSGISTVHNRAVVGTDNRSYVTNELITSSNLSRICNDTSSDIIVISAGYFDAIQDADAVVSKLGTDSQLDLSLSTKDRNTFYGAYSYMVETILNSLGDKLFYILGLTYCDIGTKTIESIRTFNTAIKNIANYYNIPFIDILCNCGVNKINRGNFLSSDRIYPNDVYGERISAFVMNSVRMNVI